MTEDMMHRLWEQGEQHLGAGRYVAAQAALEGAEAIAWRRRDAGALARIYLPLLEARRQIRYHAAEGTIVIAKATQPEQLKTFLKEEAGTILFCCGAHHKSTQQAKDQCAAVRYAARRTGRWLEALLLIAHGSEMRLASEADATFAAGLAVVWSDGKEAIGPSTDPNLQVPLPKTAAAGGTFRGSQSGPGAMARESLIVGWEALTLKWQHRHPPTRPSKDSNGPWDEMTWLRNALRVNGACEPVAMRLMALTQGVERQK